MSNNYIEMESEYDKPLPHKKKTAQLTETKAKFCPKLMSTPTNTKVH